MTVFSSMALMDPVGFMGAFPFAQKGAQMPTSTTTATMRILRAKEVRARTGLSRSTIYLAVRDGKFPPPITLGPHSIGWTSSAIDAWIESKVEGSRWPLPAPPRKPAEQKRPPTASPDKGCKSAMKTAQEQQQ
jgi:prophage regulatory protein